MEILVNGEAKQYPDQAMRLVDLLRELNIPAEGQGVAVALNFEVVPRAQWHDRELREGDKVEIITARQGG